MLQATERQTPAGAESPEDVTSLDGALVSGEGPEQPELMEPPRSPEPPTDQEVAIEAGASGGEDEPAVRVDEPARAFEVQSGGSDDDQDGGLAPEASATPDRRRALAAAAAVTAGSRLATAAGPDEEGALEEGRPSSVLLVVGRANICRSPLVHGMLQRTLAASGAFRALSVISAGVEVPTPARMCAVAAAHVGPEDAEFVTAHEARPLEPGQIRAAALVLAADRGLRSSVVRLAPGTQAKVFTWREAVGLSDAAQQRLRKGMIEHPSDLTEVAWLLHTMRGHAVLDIPEERRSGPLGRKRLPRQEDPLSVPDHHGANRSQHGRAAALTVDIATVLAERLTALASVGAPASRT